MKRTSRSLVGIRLLLIMSLFFVLAIPALAEADLTVMMIDVVGNKTVPTEKILEVITNSQLGVPVAPEKVQQDIQAIYNLGYFADIKVKTFKVFGGLKLQFEVVENAPFQKVEITGLTKVKPRELQKFFVQKPGEAFSRVIFAENLDKALKYCREKKGLIIRPKSESLEISKEGVVQIELVELKYGKIKIDIVKNEKIMSHTKEKVIRRELTFKEGDIINLKELQNNFYALMRLQIFDSVNPVLELSSIPDSLDLTLEANETHRGVIKFSISAIPDTGDWGGQVSVMDPNLMGLGQNLRLDVNIMKGGSNTVEFSFHEPWLDSNRTSFNLSLYNSTGDKISSLNSWFPDGDRSVTYDLDSSETGITLGLGRRLFGSLDTSLKVNFEKNNIESFAARDGAIAPNTAAAHPFEFWDNSLSLGMVQNRLRYEDATFVNGGYYLEGNYAVSGPYLGGEFDYQKASLEGKWFKELMPNLVFASRLKGSILSGDYPDYKQLYLGGDFQLRAFGSSWYESEATKALVGDKTILSNTELRYRLPSNKSLEFVAFYDAGQIYNQDNSVFKSDYGLGLRYLVPFLGVFRLDYAWNAETGVPKFVFSVFEAF